MPWKKLCLIGYSKRKSPTIRSPHDKSFAISRSTGIFSLSDCAREAVAEKVGMERQKLDDPFRVLFEANPLPMWIFDSNTLVFLAVNDAAIQHYGYSREQFLRMTLRDVRPPEDIDSLQHALEKVSRQQGLIDVGEWRHLRRDGSMIYVEICSQPVLYAGRNARLAMLNDITERKMTEGALRNSEARLKEAQHVAGHHLFRRNVSDIWLSARHEDGHRCHRQHDTSRRPRSNARIVGRN
jgi:PAS domain S-box-containing protein